MEKSRQEHKLTDVFGFDIGVDESTFFMKILEAQENLLCDVFDEGPGNALLLMSCDKGEKVFPQGFEDNTYVGGLGTG
jgi:hypothetical protein